MPHVEYRGFSLQEPVPMAVGQWRVVFHQPYPRVCIDEDLCFAVGSTPEDVTRQAREIIDAAYDAAGLLACMDRAPTPSERPPIVPAADKAVRSASAWTRERCVTKSGRVNTGGISG
jgi:hypothetical protein